MSAAAAVEPPLLQVRESWEELLENGGADALKDALPGFLLTRRWFSGKAHRIKAVSVADSVRLGANDEPGRLVLLRVEYAEGPMDTYVLPLAWTSGERATALRRLASQPVVARVAVSAGGAAQEGVLFDALEDDAVARAILTTVSRRRRLKGERGTLSGARTRLFSKLLGEGDPAALQPVPVGAEQSNSSVRYDERFVLKVFRRADDGMNPELEIGRFLTERTDFSHIPALAGSLEYRDDTAQRTIAVLQGYVANEGHAWEYTLEAVERYFERALIRHREAGPPAPPSGTLLELAHRDPPPEIKDLIGGYLEDARMLGQRTAQLHLALASDAGDPAFAPEPFSLSYQRSVYESARQLANRALRLLEDSRGNLRRELLPDAEHVLGMRRRILGALRRVTERKIRAMRIRCHGDYHLGQVLWTGKDFLVIDFEGEPARTLSERRIKRSPLADVAGMVRSFHYAVATVYGLRVVDHMVTTQEAAGFEPWGRCWHAWVAACFTRGYRDAISSAGLVPSSPTDLALLLDCYLLEKAMYELAYELNNRPDWVWIPLRGIRQLLEPLGA